MNGIVRRGDMIHPHCGPHPITGGVEVVRADSIPVCVKGDTIAVHDTPPCGLPEGPPHGPPVVPADIRSVRANGIRVARQEDPVDDKCMPMDTGSSIVRVFD